MSATPFKWYHGNSRPIQDCLDSVKRHGFADKEWLAELEQARAMGHVFLLQKKKCRGWTPQRGCPGHAEPLEGFKAMSEASQKQIENAIEAAASGAAK